MHNCTHHASRRRLCSCRSGAPKSPFDRERDLPALPLDRAVVSASDHGVAVYNFSETPMSVQQRAPPRVGDERSLAVEGVGLHGNRFPWTPALFSRRQRSHGRDLAGCARATGPAQPARFNGTLRATRIWWFATACCGCGPAAPARGAGYRNRSRRPHACCGRSRRRFVVSSVSVSPSSPAGWSTWNKFVPPAAGGLVSTRSGRILRKPQLDNRA